MKKSASKASSLGALSPSDSAASIPTMGRQESTRPVHLARMAPDSAVFDACLTGPPNGVELLRFSQAHGHLEPNEDELKFALSSGCQLSLRLEPVVAGGQIGVDDNNNNNNNQEEASTFDVHVQLSVPANTLTTSKGGDETTSDAVVLAGSTRMDVAAMGVFRFVEEFSMRLLPEGKQQDDNGAPEDQGGAAPLQLEGSLKWKVSEERRRSASNAAAAAVEEDEDEEEEEEE